MGVATATPTFTPIEWGAVRLRPWNGDLSLLRGTLMTLTYRGQKYTKTVVAASALRRSALVYRGQTVNK